MELDSTRQDNPTLTGRNCILNYLPPFFAAWMLLVGSTSTQAEENRPLSSDTTSDVKALESIEQQPANEVEVKENLPHTLQRSNKPAVNFDKTFGSRRLTQDTGFLSLAWPMAAVLLLIFTFSWMAKRWLNRPRQAGQQAIRILSRQQLSSKQSLCLLRVGRRVVMVGVTPDRISQVTEISDPQEVAELVADIESSQPGSFRSTLAQMTGARQQESDIEMEDEGTLGHRQMATAGADVRRLVDRVRQLSREDTASDAAA